MELEATYQVDESALSASEKNSDVISCIHIHDQTYLATDYLNHFNEIVMLIEMLPELPDVYADIVAWEPVSYAAHFSKSGFAYAELAIEAYKNAPPDIKALFDALISDIDQSVITGRQELLEAFDKKDNTTLTQRAAELSYDLRKMIDRASAIINGTGQSAQDQADSIFENI